MRTCYACGCPQGKGKDELRPYGPGGKDVCAGCVFGRDGSGPNAEKVATATAALHRRLAVPGVLLIDSSEQAGPRSFMVQV